MRDLYDQRKTQNRRRGRLRARDRRLAGGVLAGGNFGAIKAAN
jgi:hypothetical protein